MGLKWSGEAACIFRGSVFRVITHYECSSRNLLLSLLIFFFLSYLENMIFFLLLISLFFLPTKNFKRTKLDLCLSSVGKATVEGSCFVLSDRICKLVYEGQFQLILRQFLMYKLKVTWKQISSCFKFQLLYLLLRLRGHLQDCTECFDILTLFHSLSYNPFAWEFL